MNIKWVVLGVLLVLIAGTPAASQGIDSTKGKVATRYDRFEDVTLVTADNMLVAEGKMAKLVLKVLSTYRGRSLAPFEVVELHFLSLAPTPRLQNRPFLAFLLNGQSFRLGEIRTKPPSLKHGIFYEEVFSQIELATFVKLARAKTLEGRIGQTEFRLSESHLSILRSLVEKYSTSAESIDRETERRASALRSLDEQTGKLQERLNEMEKQQADLVNLERLTRAVRRADTLREQLRTLTVDETDRRAQLARINYALKSTNLDSPTPLSKEEREQRRRQLENEKSRIQERINQIEVMRKPLEAEIIEADAAVDRLGSQRKPN